MFPGENLPWPPAREVGSCFGNLKKLSLHRLSLVYSQLDEIPLKVDNLDLLRGHPTLERIELVGRSFSDAERQRLSERIGIRIVGTPAVD
jgi:hypothetical protein